jgi:hypothetical protein
MSRDVLIHASTVQSGELRHEISVSAPDAFLYGEHDGQPFAVVDGLDAPAVRDARPGRTAPSC